MKNDEKFEKSLEPIINVMYGRYSGGDKKSIGIRFCNVSKNIALNIKIVNYIINNFKTGESKIITKNEIVLPCVEPIYTREYVLNDIENFNNDSKLEINFEYSDVNEKKFYGKFFVIHDDGSVKFVHV